MPQYNQNFVPIRKMQCVSIHPLKMQLKCNIKNATQVQHKTPNPTPETTQQSSKKGQYTRQVDYRVGSFHAGSFFQSLYRSGTRCRGAEPLHIKRGCPAQRCSSRQVNSRLGSSSRRSFLQIDVPQCLHMKAVRRRFL